MVEDFEIEERRTNLRRFLRIGIVAWAAFFITDIVAWHVHDAPFEFLAALRFAGTGFVVAMYVIARRRDVSLVAMRIIEASIFPVAALLVSIAAVVCGGVTSPLAHGVGIITLLRAILPARWVRGLPIVIGTAATFPLTMAVASHFDPTVANDLELHGWTFAETTGFLLCGAVLAAAASHVQWYARKQVQEARKLGNYRLVARLGAGGMGEVWLAHQIPLDRPVAIKLLKSRLGDNPDAIRRFQREARAASSLSHPNTIRVFDFGASDDGVFYIAMELLDGLDMEALVRKTGPLPPARAIHLLRQACLSLAEAHHAGIVHCDVKPANLFVAKAGNVLDFVKVLDFGLVHVMNAPGASTIVDSIRGTPSFMPPEAVRGERVGPESDVYSLGAVLYFMVTATTVFRAQTFHEMALAQVDAMPESPSQRLGSSLPADLETVILRCLSKARGDRYATAKDLEEALGKCAAAKGWTAEDARASWALLRPSLTTAVTKPG